jgi:cyclopropane-fatty-acyl-phospholipid synthase
MFWDRPLDHALSNLKKHVRAPVRLVLWDGREVALSDAPTVTLRFKYARTAAILARPSMLSLAEAYIAGDAEIEGDVRTAIHSAAALAKPR